MKRKILIVEDQIIEAKNLQRLLEKAEYHVTGIARSVQLAVESIQNERPDLVLLDIFVQGELTGIDLATILRQKGVAFIYLSANSNQNTLDEVKLTKPYGFLVKPFREKDLIINLDIAWYLHAENERIKKNKANVLKIKLNEVVKTSSGSQDLVYRAVNSMGPFLPFDFIYFHAKKASDPEPIEFCFTRITYNKFESLSKEKLLHILGLTKIEFADYANHRVTKEKSELFELTNTGINKNICIENLFAKHLDLKSGFRICLNRMQVNTVFVFSKQANVFTKAHIDLMEDLEDEINNLLVQDNNSQNNAMSSGSSYGVSTNQAKFSQEEVNGSSAAFSYVQELVAAIAATDTSVLLLGETGTGKERVARYIHRLSNRNRESFVTLNCAALSASLAESELFGHEKGSFTGAIERRIGKFEQANGGTLFLDEIGEMPKDIQVKLLRVLQDQQFERIGGCERITTNVRLIAATNRNLEKEVADGRFRLDLYYRLNVFPVTLPPLRDRKEDIPDLAMHFLQTLSKKMTGTPKAFSTQALKIMQMYEWPGNIRELENVVERTALLTTEEIIHKIYLPTKQGEAEQDKLSLSERDQILQAIQICKGKISGVGGAAELLKMPATTLHSKMKKFNIKTVFA